MENAPTEPEDNSSDKKPAKKKKKSTEALGAFVVDAKPEAKPESPKTLFGESNKADTKETPDDDAEEAESLDELSPEEEAHILAELIAARRSIEVADSEQEPRAESELEAIEAFRERVLEGEPTEQALNETLEELSEMAEAETNLITTPHAEDLGAELHDFGEEAIYLREAEASEAVNAGQSAGGQAAPPRRPVAWSFNAPGDPPPRGTSFNSTPVASAAAETTYVDNRAGDLLLGGIIGYLIGRRRGRIKTEKRLKPIQKKLAKRVEALQEDLVTKETVIRTQAVQLRNERRQLDRLANRTKMGREPNNMKANSESQPRSSSAETPVSKDGGVGKRAPEHIGHVLVDVEAKQAGSVAKAEKPTAEVKAKNINKETLTMSRQELLAVSEKIRVEGTSLRQIYETRLVGERGLRRLVAEHLKGGDVKRQLRNEIIEREIDFERDPLLRDRVGSEEGMGSSTLKELLEKAGANQTGESEEIAFYRARAAFESEEQYRQKQQRRALDVGMITSIVVLAIIIGLLLFER
jgi:hypothetical protein